MKMLLFPVLVILMMSVGCTCLPGSLSGGNQPPAAYIDSISPADASVGEAVSFQGHGTDADGDVVAYRWRSDVDGDLGTTANFETSSLSAGAHVVYFKIQDNNGDWSDEVRSRITVSGGAAAVPAINSFGASPGSITSGASSTLSWDVSDATAVSIDKGVGAVAATGTTAVSPFTTTQYTLTATNAAGSTTATTQVVVLGAAPPPSGGLPVINSFSAVPPIIDAGSSTSLSWNVSNATSVTIDQGVGPVAFVGSTPASPAATTSYTLTATNASGWSSVTIPVVVGAAPAAGEPDLVILDVSRDGDTIYYTIKNQGLGVAGASTSVLLVDGVVKGFDNVDSLAAGAESTESFGYSYTCSAPSDTIVVHADKDSVVDESNEDNNAYSEDWICIFFIPPIIPIEHTVTLFSIEDEDGQVMQDGGTGFHPNVGDRSTGVAMQAFLSFDTSGIPCGATVTSASLDLSTGDMLGDPFAGLGWMRVYSDQYGSLDGGDFTPDFPTGAIKTFSSRPVAPFTSSGLTSAVQAVTCAMVPRFRVRIQFESYTDGDGEADCLRLGSAQPILVVTYEE